MIHRHELTDEQWQAIEPLLSVSGAKGRPRVDHRRVINGTLFKARTGVAWRELPEQHGPWKTVYNRFWRWSRIRVGRRPNRSAASAVSPA